MSDEFDISEAVDTMQEAKERKQKEREELVKALKKMK